MSVIAYSVYLALSCLMLSCYYGIVLYSVYSFHDPFSCLHAEKSLDLPDLCLTVFFHLLFLRTTQVHRKGIFQLSSDLFQLEESKCIA